MKNIKLKYHGFKPSGFFHEYLQEQLIRATADVPYGSFVSGHFSRKKKLIKGFVQLHSTFNNFVASAEGERLKDVTKKITNQLRKKINKRKKRRFNHDRITDFLINEQEEQFLNSQEAIWPYTESDLINPKNLVEF